MAFSPDGTLLATASWDKTARLWDMATGECVRTFTGHKSYINAVAFSPDGTLLATGGGEPSIGGGERLTNDDTARLWNVATGKRVRTLTGHTCEISGMAFSPDGTLLATTGSWDRTVRLWNVATGKCVQTHIGHTSEISGVAFSPDGALLATGSRDNTARLWG